MYKSIKSSVALDKVLMASNRTWVSGNLASNNPKASSGSNLAHLFIYIWAKDLSKGLNQSIALKNISKAFGSVQRKSRHIKISFLSSFVISLKGSDKINLLIFFNFVNKLSIFNSYFPSFSIFCFHNLLIALKNSKDI